MTTPLRGRVRVATTGDVPAIAAVLEAKRVEYERYSPVFWRPAEGARAMHEPFLQALVEQDGPVAFVEAERGSSDITGAIVAMPRAEDWLVDDFAVARPEHWADGGDRLLAAVRATVAGTPVTVVCAERDETERAMLRRSGGRLVEQWWVRPLDDVAAPPPSDPAGATGLVVAAPPVYDPGGPVCQVVAWDGSAIALRSIEAWARGRGVVLAIVSVAANAPDRREVLREVGYTVASDWYRFEAADPA